MVTLTEKDSNDNNDNDTLDKIVSLGSLASNPLVVKANQALIRHPLWLSIYRDVITCMELSQISDEPQCAALEGESGAGKSTLVRAIERAYPRYNIKTRTIVPEESNSKLVRAIDRVQPRYKTETRTIVPVFVVQVPNPCTIKGLSAVMLRKLGDPAWDRGTQWSMDARLILLLGECGVKLVVLDDMHQLIDGKTDRVAYDVADWCKVLIKESGTPFLAVGLVGMVDRVLRSNVQLSRLFATRATLAPFEFDGRQASTVRDFSKFLDLVMEAVGIPLVTTLEKVDLLYRVHYASRGLVGFLMNLMRTAQQKAILRGSSAIELIDLAASYSQRLEKDIRRPNSFLNKDGSIPTQRELIAALPTEQRIETDELASQAGATGQRSRTRTQGVKSAARPATRSNKKAS